LHVQRGLKCIIVQIYNLRWKWSFYDSVDTDSIAKAISGEITGIPGFNFILSVFKEKMKKLGSPVSHVATVVAGCGYSY